MSNYSRGNDYERRVADELRGDGYQCWQTRGSKSAADIIALKPGQVLLVQVKGASEQISSNDWNALYSLAALVLAEPIVADFPKWKPSKAGPVRYRRISGEHRHYAREWPCEEFTPDEIGKLGELF